MYFRILGLAVILCCLSCVKYHYRRFQETIPEQRSGDLQSFEESGLLVGVGIGPDDSQPTTSGLWYITVYWGLMDRDIQSPADVLESIRILKLDLFDVETGKAIAEDLSPSASLLTGSPSHTMLHRFERVQIGDSISTLRAEITFSSGDSLNMQEERHATFVLDRKEGSYRAPPGWLLH